MKLNQPVMGMNFIQVQSGLTNRSIIFAGALGESLHDASGHNPVGVGSSWVRIPRVARASQPWAGGRNPVGVGNGVGEVIRGKAGLKLLAAGALTGQAESLSHFASRD